MMNKLALFYISIRSDKPVGMMSGKEDGQGITVGKAFFRLEIVHFKKASCVS